VYAYIHSGTTLNTTGFFCSWDSGQSGIIFATHEDIRKAYGRTRITKKLRQTVEKILACEVYMFSQYIGGEVYTYSVKDSVGEEVDSCSGYYEEDDCVKDAKAAVDSMVGRKVA